MSSENGVVLEQGIGEVEPVVSVEGLTLNLNKENEIVENAVNVPEVNGIAEDALDVEGVVNGTGVQEEEEEEASAEVSSPAKISKSSKKPGVGDVLKSNKGIKDQGSKKVSAAVSRGQKPSLSQSLSMPTRGVQANGLKKSIDGKSVKTDTPNSRTKGAESAALATSRLNHPNRRASTGIVSTDTKSKSAATSTRRSTLSAAPAMQVSVSANTDSPNAITDGPMPEISVSPDQNPKPLRKLQIKDDDDVHSVTSSTTPSRGSGSGFAFRLGERAEKRREFFSKVEEKIHAREVERNNLQEKSKENQEAEIKQLRKSLTFKATPMPSFYKEPAPAKVELKKIPTTRAVSPKLGRHKVSGAADNSSEGGGSCQSPRPGTEVSKSATKRTSLSNNGDSSGSKTPIRKSLTKLPSRKSTTPRTEGKSLTPKAKAKDTEVAVQKDCIAEKTENEGNQNSTVVENLPLETKEIQSSTVDTLPDVIADNKNSTAENLPLEIEAITEYPDVYNETILDLPDPEIPH